MTEIHDLNDQDRQIIEEFRANLVKETLSFLACALKSRSR